MRALRGRRGISLVELLVAVLILSVGILGMAGGTGWVLRMVELSRLDTQRAIALQGAVERVKSIPLAGVQGGSAVTGSFTTTWTVLSSDANSATLRFVLTGPGRSGSTNLSASISPTAADTLVYTRVR